MEDEFKETIIKFPDKLVQIYTLPLIKYLKNNPHLIKTCPGMLVNFDEISFYVFRSHIAIEYDGPYNILDINRPINMKCNFFVFMDKECDVLEGITGFKYTKGDSDSFILPVTNEELVVPTLNGLDKLVELKWNFFAQNMKLIISQNISIDKKRPTRIINSYFFDANSKGLMTRHVKWLEILPINFKENDNFYTLEWDTFFLENAYKIDASYCFDFPDDYKYKLLPIINRFIELWGNDCTKETTITKFLSKNEHQFIIKKKFGVIKISPETICIWQNSKKENLKPDFFIIHPNGYADIVDFKLPKIDKVIVGTVNRRSFSAKLNQYIAQMREYANFFNEECNRVWFEKEYGFKVKNPRKYLIIGRRNNFSNDEWREILADYQNIEIFTYDDLIDSVTSQFYMVN
ncbi:Uncharacterised protein [Legionella busanensis]|uniref:Shedu protein SduA C-terminal domain-containing protein n=1 Tax=Legionella busanensis TaxID=190655 RepID=A0A378JKC0_9GAMM|nr:Shedu anti-phage system protein SduA domain-containing protein [Legionella busanensis]STX50763.1 Uncharacterised protein [Legionella busanensis]